VKHPRSSVAVGSRVPAQEPVPGDVVVFEGGDMVTARTCARSSPRCWKADESVLTGESLPVGRTPRRSCRIRLAERRNMLFRDGADAGIGLRWSCSRG
jgi:Ca2+-transporting ATPase